MKTRLDKLHNELEHLEDRSSKEDLYRILSHILCITK